MILEAGELDTRIRIERRSDKRDSVYGSLSPDNVEIGTYWGKLQQLSNRNYQIAKGFAATVEYQAKLRYRPEVSNNCVAVIGGKQFYVNGVVHDPTQKPNWTELFLTKIEG